MRDLPDFWTELVRFRTHGVLFYFPIFSGEYSLKVTFFLSRLWQEICRIFEEYPRLNSWGKPLKFNLGYGTPQRFIRFSSLSSLLLVGRGFGLMMGSGMLRGGWGLVLLFEKPYIFCILVLKFTPLLLATSDRSSNYRPAIPWERGYPVYTPTR